MILLLSVDIGYASPILSLYQFATLLLNSASILPLVYA
jgi:hypothetical protein